VLAGTAASALGLRYARGQGTGAKGVKIGVLTDMSGPYRDLGGPNLITCIRQAVQDSGVVERGIPVEIILADHQNKADIGTSVARHWMDNDGVDCIADINHSAIAIALTKLCVDRDKFQLQTGSALSDLTNVYCTPNMIHWAFDSWQMAHAACVPLVQSGAKKWFFITADYSFGHVLQRDATSFVEQAGGTVVGSVAYPFPDTADFSSLLVRAQASGADVVGLATAGADNVNIIKQASEFGLQSSGMRIAGLALYITDLHAIRLAGAQNVLLSEVFYWDANTRSRAFTGRVRPRLNGWVPNQEQASGYSGVFNYLRTVAALGVEPARSGRAVVAALKQTGLDDDAMGPGLVRVDGQGLHPAYLFRTKKPADSHGEWDMYDLVSTVPADQAFRPLAESRCPIAKT
jgi:branched-chain amino acid transport system substrate-binding protein